MQKFNLEELQQGLVLLVDKPLLWSSTDVVRKVKFASRAKIGHAGTLDPMATGLLLLGTGRMTKKLTELTGLDKEYTGAFYLGATTPSYDRETEPENIRELDGLTEADIYAATAAFTGTVQQQPPVYSAIRVQGKRSYELARKGVAEELNFREVRIPEFEITSIELPLVRFRVVCSKGTYIRSLAHDFGKALGVGAYLHELCRTRIGEYRLEEAWELQALLDEINSQKNEHANHAGTP